MLNSRDINILKNKYKKLYSIKFKIKNIILKSIFKNRNINTNIRAVCYLNINQKKFINNKYYRICKYSGYPGAVNKYTSYGRHELNRKAILGELQNINVSS